MTTSTSSPRMTPASAKKRPIAEPIALENGPLDLAGRTVLLATDGSAGTQAATRFAAALAARYHACIHVVMVVDTSPAPIPPPIDMALAMTDAAVGTTVHEQQAEVLRKSIADLTGKACDWPVRVKLGIPARAIVRQAMHMNAVLVVLGLQRHSRLDRALNDETVLHVMRTATCPVIGVAADMTTLPTRIVAAVDFSAASLAAARAASAIAGDESSLVLAYVPPLFTYVPGDGEGVIHEMGVQAAFERTTKALTRPGVSIESVTLPHDLAHPVAKTLLKFSDDTHADLIAAGSAAHSRVDRWMIGSVSTDLVRDGRRSVLIMPPR